MRSEGMFEMNGIKKLNFIEVHTCKKSNFLLTNKYNIILFKLLRCIFKNQERTNIVKYGRNVICTIYWWLNFSAKMWEC